MSLTEPLQPLIRRNQALYARHGFRITTKIPVPDGPVLTAMWRSPRP